MTPSTTPTSSATSPGASSGASSNASARIPSAGSRAGGSRADRGVSPLMRGLGGLVLVWIVLALVGNFNEAIGLPRYFLVLSASVLFWVTQATSWNILSGYAGYFSFGQGAYLALGAYTTAVLNGRHGWNFFVTVPLGALAGGLLAFAVGAVAFRLRSLRGEIFALLTLAVPFILAAFARINHDIDGGQGTTVPVPEFPAWLGETFQHLLYQLNLVVAALAVGIALAIHRSRLGRGLAAIHDAEEAAEVLGVPTFRYKMIAIVIGGALGGMSGSLFTLQIGFVTVESVFNLMFPLFVIVMSVLGGRAHWLGPVIGAVLVVLGQDLLTGEHLSAWSSIIFGGLLAILVVVAGDGLYARLRAHPLPALIAFVVVTGGCFALGTLTSVASLLFGLIAGAAAAVVAGVRTARPSGRGAVPGETRAEPETPHAPETEAGDSGPASDDADAGAGASETVAGDAAPVPASGSASEAADVAAPVSGSGSAPGTVEETADASESPGETVAPAIDDPPAPPAKPAPTGGPDRTGNGTPLVEIEGVSKNFGGVRALSNVSFSVGEGEIVGLVGPNGSGKTTLVNLLSGALQPSEGTIRIAGRPIGGLAAHRIAHAGVARTYQIPKPFASMNVRDNVAMAVMFGRDHASLAEARRVAERHLATVHLEHLADAYPADLNLHQRQLLEMARAIAADPIVLLLDEALAGLNPAEIDDAVEVIKRIHGAGISIIIVEHLLRVLRGLATRLVVIDRGVQIADGEPAAVLDDPAVVEAYVGRQSA
ncbi:ATP-binding cassette domain-containing protein [Thermopolyspora sp. NPDC052614]|uniref:ABC transporter permease subunit n=1 Tax=Thermopolyspora sp. NPDC052614 TaxID=3155682 RepID=UPI003424739A